MWWLCFFSLWCFFLSVWTRCSLMALSFSPNLKDLTLSCHYINHGVEHGLNNSGVRGRPLPSYNDPFLICILFPPFYATRGSFCHSKPRKFNFRPWTPCLLSQIEFDCNHLLNWMSTPFSVEFRCISVCKRLRKHYSTMQHWFRHVGPCGIESVKRRSNQCNELLHSHSF